MFARRWWVVAGVLSCGPAEPHAEDRSAAAPPAPAADRSLARRCAPPPGVTASPTSIHEAVALLNALPNPVDVACFVESLDRPLHVFASASPFSAQPSADVRSPRIFIRNGALTMSVVPIGMGKDLLEFGQDAGQGRTTKGEVQLPVVGPIAEAAPFERIQIGEATTCGVCHDDEARAPGLGLGFASKVLEPLDDFDVPLANLASEAASCGATPPANEVERGRCRLLHALLDHGEVRPASLPPGGRICHGP